MTAIIDGTKISDLPAISTLADTDKFPVVQSGVSNRVSLSQVKSFIFPIIDVRDYVLGGTWIAKTQAAHDAMSFGGILDLRGLTGTQLATTKLSISKPCFLLLPINTLRSTVNDNMIDIACGAVHILGYGKGISILRHDAPNANLHGIYAEDPGNPILDLSFEGFTIDGAGSATAGRSALKLVDIEETNIWNFSIRNWSDASKTSNGLHLYGRQSINLKNIRVFADQPLRLSKSPNTAGTGVTFDSSQFEGIYLAADVTKHIIDVDSDVNPTSINWSGQQSWVGGSHGFYWSGYNGSDNSYQLSFKNVRGEQGQTPIGTNYLFYIDPVRQCFSVRIEGCLNDSFRNFIYVRNCLNTKLDNNTYFGAGIALNVDSTVATVEVGNFWNKGTTATPLATISDTGAKRTIISEDELDAGIIVPKINLKGTDPQYQLNSGQLGATIAAKAAGTVYTLTASSAAIDFGTTDPAIVLDKTGTYRITGRVVVKFNSATFAANQLVQVKFRRTNNTPSDLTGGTTTLSMDIITTKTQSFVIQLPEVIYGPTANTNDAIALYSHLSALPSAGSVTIEEAEILAQRIR